MLPVLKKKHSGIGREHVEKKKVPPNKKRLSKQLLPDSGRNWVCLFCRADSVRFPRSDAVGSPSPGTVFAWEIPDPNGEKMEKSSNLWWFIAKITYTWWWFDAIYNPHNGTHDL